MSAFTNQFIRKNNLSEQDVMRMYQLIDSYYENITPKEFLRTLAKIDYVFLVRGEQDSILAYITLQFIHMPDKKQNIYGLLAGDVITHKDYMADTNIFMEAISSYHLQVHKHRACYVYLACKDARTYQMFQETFYHCYPNQKEKTPLYAKKLINLFGEYYFHHEFEKSTGLIKHICFPRRIKENRMVTYREAWMAESEFFYQKNPEYQKGYELICVAKLSENKSNGSKNLT